MPICLRLPTCTSYLALLLCFAGLHSHAWSAQNKNSTAPTPSATPLICSATDFKALAYTINDAQIREERANEWLSKYGKVCPLDQLEIILINQAVWLGTANTPSIISSIETFYKKKKAAAEELEKSVDKPKGSANNKK